MIYKHDAASGSENETKAVLWDRLGRVCWGRNCMRNLMGSITWDSSILYLTFSHIQATRKDDDDA